MGKLKGVASPLHSDEEKIAISKRVCDLYESQWATIESVCKEVGIGASTFRLWAVQIGEIGEMYKKAKTKSEEHYFEERLKPRVMRSLEKLVDGFDEVQEVEEDVVWQGVMAKDEFGKPLRKNKVTRSHVAPNPTGVIFGMKVVFPDKTRDGVDVTSKGDKINQSPLDGLSIEDKAQILRLLLKKNADK